MRKVKVVNKVSGNIKEWVEINGKKNGLYAEYTPNGDTIELREYKDGLLDGITKLFTTSGTPIVESRYTTGKLNGVHKSWYPGEKQLHCVARYTDNKLDGPYITFYPNGQPNIMVYYINGVRTGYYLEWSSEGALLNEICTVTSKL